LDAPFTVLFTGFGPFLNFTTNPTMVMALALQQDPCHDVTIIPEPASAVTAFAVDGSSSVSAAQSNQVTLHICFHAHVLPVNRTGAMWTSEYLSSRVSGDHRVPFDMVVHTGLENSAKGLKLEIAATNQQANDTGGGARGHRRKYR
jgi:hypothetical protein